MSASEFVDVAILGFGPVGQMAANQLGLRGIRTACFEQQSGPFKLPRAVATDDEVLRIFQSVGLAERVMEEMSLDQQIQFADRHGDVVLRFKPLGAGSGFSGIALFYQPYLERTLCEGVERFDNVSVEFNHRAETLDPQDEFVDVWVRDLETGRSRPVRAKYVLACDGARSMARVQCRIGFSGSTAEQGWLVVDCEVPRPLEHLPHIRYFSTPRAGVTMPLSARRHHRWEWMLEPDDDPEEIVSPESVRALLEPWADVDELNVIRAAVYNYQVRMAERWRRGRVLLLGDAAHLMPQFAGQGMSAGLRDAANACWKVAAIVKGDADPKLLDSYETERRTNVAMFSRFTRILGGIVQTRRPSLVALRDTAMKGLTRSPLGKRLEKGGATPATMYDTGAFVPGGRGRRRTAGTMFPQPDVRASDGETVRLDEVLGQGWSLLGMGVDPKKGMSEESLALWERLGARTAMAVAPGTDGAAPDTGTTRVEDVDGGLAEWFEGKAGSVVTLRPDHVLFALTRPEEPDLPAQHYRELIGLPER